MAEMRAIIWIPYLASDGGAILGGWASGRLIRAGKGDIAARQVVMLYSAMGMPLGILIVLTESSVLAIALMCLVLFSHMSWKTNLMTLTVDVFPKRIVGSMAGIVATGSGLGGAIFTGIAGYLIDWYSYTPVFMIMGFLHPIGFLIVRWLVFEKADLSNHSPQPQDNSQV